MLLELEIKDFILIDQLNLQFNKGLNILTGETGVGKSIIIDAVNMAIGERADRNYVRSGSRKAVIQATFDISNMLDLKHILGEHQVGLDDDKILTVTREIYATGRSISRINGVIVNQSILRSITEHLIDIHGQHQHQSLFNTGFHINILDLYAGRPMDTLLRKYSKEYNKYIELIKELNNFDYDEMERVRKIDLLKFQLEEIDAAQPILEEEEKINQLSAILTNSEKIHSILANIYQNIYQGNNGPSALGQISEAVGSIHEICNIDDKLNYFYLTLLEIQDKLGDVIIDIRNYGEEIDFNPALLQETQEKLDIIHNLKRKYGKSIDEIFKYKEIIEFELDSYINSEKRILEIKNKINEIEKYLTGLSKKINKLRVKTAKSFEEKLVNTLAKLNMGRISFSIEISQLKDESGNLKFTARGSDRVEFMISTNKGEPLKPLSKIVSGGEVSRIMLALKTILADIDNIPVLIFDEIDTGISGITAQVVAEKLYHISINHQVICITHLPQIAAVADTHFLIDKKIIEDTTQTIVQKLDKYNRVYELGRLLGGDITKITLQHAEELIENARKRN
mgnify:CR=1 FL=1